MEQETVFVIMLKNKETGFLEKELGSLNINKNDEYIVNLFVLKEDDGEKLHLRISTDRDVEDWEYGAIFDNYNYDSYGDNVIEIDEIDNDYNPVWEIVIDYDDNLSVVEERVAEILDIHSKHLEKWSKSAGMSTGRSAGLSAYNRTIPYQTVSRCQIFTSFKSSNDSVCGHRGEFGGKQNSKNEAILGLTKSSTQNYSC